jgi:regulator of telomere elongation helicase 1
MAVTEPAAGWRSLFPYEPYPQQVDFMNDVESTLGSGGTLIAEACNGFGKTVSALSALLTLGKPIKYATRTHDQVRQVLAEVERINIHADASYSAVNLASRDHLCLNPDCKGIPSREAQELCGVLRKEERCPYKSELNETPTGLPRVLSVDSLISMGRRMRICPYYLARRVAKTRNLTVCPYPYVFDPKIRMMTGLDLEGRLLVLDEGHNADQVGQETLSDTLSDRILAAASDELKLVGMNRAPLRRLEDHLAEVVTDQPTLVKAEETYDNVAHALGGDLPVFIENHASAVETIRGRKEKAGEPPLSYLNGVLNFLDLLMESRKDRYVAIYQKANYGSNQLEYRCLDPSLAIRPIVDTAAGTLFMSGTMSPLPLFAEVLGLHKAELRSYPAIETSDKIKMTIDPSVTTTYRDRGPEMLRKIGMAVSNALKEVPNGALIFFPQRTLMESSLDAWTQVGLIQVTGGRPYLAGKPLFREGRDAKTNQETVARYKAAAVTPQGAILTCVFRGRNSEGSNFPEDQCRGIVLVGVPYANYGDPLVRAQIAYYDRRSMGLGNRWYTMDAFRASNQALGRGIRSREDWCHYWLLDQRYGQHQDLISAWAKGAGPTIATPETL